MKLLHVSVTITNAGTLEISPSELKQYNFQKFILLLTTSKQSIFHAVSILLI